jgi:hypothetical protein
MDRPGTPSSLNRLVRPIGFATVLILIGAVLLLGWDWLSWLSLIGLPRYCLTQLAVGVLQTFLLLYFVILIVAALGTAVLGWVVWQSRSKGRVARWFLLCGSTLLGLIVAEAVAAARHSWIRGLPAMPRQFPGPPGSDHDGLIMVVGDSSALGVPYEGWLSIGAIIASELRKALPTRRFQVQVLAEKGATLESMQQILSRLTTHPDALIVYSGHNEFLARFSLSNRVAYYFDELPSRRAATWLEQAGSHSPLYTLVRQNWAKYRVGIMPARSLGSIETLVGRPVCTPAETRAVVVDFQRRLEAIVSDCEQIGCLPILIIPPSNDAFDPSQSHATPETSAAERQALFRRLIEIRAIEEQSPGRAIAAYQEIVARQPTHAQAHYRLARLLELAGSWDEANGHYILARDHDGMPLRCITALQAAYRFVGQRHRPSVILVDGPAILRAKSRNGILDGHFFHDNVHPTLAGHVALAEAVLAGLKARAAFNWPVATPAQALNPQRCADEFGLSAAAWATVCERTAVFYDGLAFLTLDSAERVQWRDRYTVAARLIRAGTRPEDVGIAGIGPGR